MFIRTNITGVKRPLPPNVKISRSLWERDDFGGRGWISGRSCKVSEGEGYFSEGEGESAGAPTRFCNGREPAIILYYTLKPYWGTRWFTLSLRNRPSPSEFRRERDILMFGGRGRLTPVLKLAICFFCFFSTTDCITFTKIYFIV